MLTVYLNYPNRRISVHQNLGCGRIQVMAKPNQRVQRIDIDTISTELQRFRGHEYRFASHAQLNDMWLELDFADVTFELSVVRYIAKLLCAHYTRFCLEDIEVHCKTRTEIDQV